jgi:hypothetical protein
VIVMTVTLNPRALALAACLTFACGVAAAAEEVTIPDGQLPPPERTEPEKPKPCVTDQSGFRTRNGVNQYWVELTNSCATRQRCRINVYVVGSRGGRTGAATLILDKAAHGGATKTWTIRTTENGGMATMSRKCSAI